MNVFPLVNVKKECTLIVKSISILFAVGLFYYRDIILIMNEALVNEFLSYLIVIPFLEAYLLYRKRRMLKATMIFKKTKFHEIYGIILCAIAILIYWHGSYTFHTFEYHIISLPIFAAGCILIIFNMKTLKTLAFPIAFLFLLLPPPSEVIRTLGKPLSIFSSEATYKILKTIGMPVYLANEYGTPIITTITPQNASIEFAIDIACSGIYSIMSFMIFTFFITYISKGEFWKKTIVFLIGAPFLYFLNIIRTTLIVLIGYNYGMEIGIQLFHLFGGCILIFIGTLIILGISEKTLKIKLFPKRQKINSVEVENEIKKGIKPEKHVFYLTKIAFLMAIVIFISFIQVPFFTLAENPLKTSIQTLGGEQSSSETLPQIPGYNLFFLYRDKEYEKLLGEDAALVYVYYPNKTVPDKTRNILWVTIEVARSSVFDEWEVCLLDYPFTEVHKQIELKNIQILENPPKIGRFFAYKNVKTNETRVYLYWHEQALFETDSGFEKRYARISLIMYGLDEKDVPGSERFLSFFAEKIVNYWRPIKVGSQIILLISQEGIFLIETLVILMLATLSFELTQNLKNRKYTLRIYNRLTSDEDKFLLEAVYRAAKKEKATLDNINTIYNELTGKSVDRDLLLKKLEYAEKAGLVEKDIGNKDENPVLTWRSRVPFKIKNLKKMHFLSSDPKD